MERVNNIKPTTPYMLRQDGALFACGTVHPYIKMYYSADFEKNWNELMNVNPQFLDWFYEHTLNEETKNLIENIRSNKDEELFNKLNNATNQEFCRVRTSNFKYKYGGDNGQLYFRISSKGFNWYDAIWKVISDNIDWIQYVTVMRDYQTFGKQFDYLKLKGEPINEMPIDDFLTASGNPVLEKLENLNEGEDMNKVDRIDNFINELYELRQQSIAKDGEYGVGNLVFKEMRSKGYLDNLKDMKTDLENKEMSLEGLNEDTVKQNGKWVNKGDEGTHGKFDTKKEADAQRKAMFANGYHESLNEAEDEEPSLEDTLEQCFIEKGCNYERQANGIFKFNDEDSFDKAYDSVQVLAGQSQVDIDGMRLKVQGEQTQPDVASGSAPTSDYGAYLPDEDAEVEESLNEVAGWQVAKWQKAQGEKRAQKAASYTDADKTEKTKSFTPAQLDAIKLTSLSADEQEKLKNSKMTKVQFDKLSGWIKSLKARQFGADYKSNVRADLYEIEKLCKDILNESLEEANQDPLQSKIYKKEANKQKKNPDHYMPRGGLNKGLGDPAQSIKAFNHMMGADNFSGGASMADGTVGAVSVGGGMGEAMDPNAKKTQIDENEIKDFLKNSREGQDPIDITDQIVDIFGYDDKLFDEILDFVSHQMFNGKEEKSDLDRVLDNNTTGKWEDDNGQFVIDATRLNKEDLVIIYYKDKEEKVYQVKIHNYMGKTDTVKDAAKTIDIASLVHEHAGELIEPDDVVSNTIEWSEDGDDDIEVTIFLVND